ncbi:MAG: hypothetical protein ACXW4Q_03145, partial [Anaerolineales bacterium]
GMEMRGPRNVTTLTDQQKSQIQTILSEYDPQSLTSEKAQEIFSKFREAGIAPAKGMKEAIEAAGFDAEQLRSLGMPNGGPQHGRMQQPQALTEDQKSQVQTILSNYDPEDLTTDDVKSILQQFREADIRPASDLAETIKSAGFNANSILKMPRSDHLEQHFWASQTTSQSLNKSALQSLQNILNQYDLANLSDDQEQGLYKQLQESGILSQGVGLNLTA